MPVSKGQAAHRAGVCAAGDAGKRCPHNKASGWSLTTATAAFIQREAEKQNQLKLHVENERELGVCDCCGCYLPLKVWVPWLTLYKHLSDDQFRKFPGFCWLNTEKPK